MSDFKKIELSDKEWIDRLTRVENSRSADFNFGNIFMWDDRFNQNMTFLNDRLLVMPRYSDSPFFSYPIGDGDLEAVIGEMLKYSMEHGFPMRILGATKEHIKDLERLFPGKFVFNETRALFDYIYNAEKLATLSGKKLHGKRNHINRFVENNDWSFHALTAEHIPECAEMLVRWADNNSDLPENEVYREYIAIMRGLRNFDALGLEGGVLRSNGEVVAFTVGELISSDTYNTHFEKAYSNIQGAYQMVNREFARQILDLHPNVVYINREDDMGRDNLRQAKLSYYPEFLLEKYSAQWIG